MIKKYSYGHTCANFLLHIKPGTPIDLLYTKSLSQAMLYLYIESDGKLTVKAHFVITAHHVTTRAFRNKISAHFVTMRIS